MGCRQSKITNSISNDKGPRKISERSIEIEKVRTEVIPKPNIIEVVSEETTVTEELIETQQMVGQASKTDQDTITKEVHEALVQYLPNYNVDPFKDEFGVKLYYTSIEVMRVAREKSILLSPDLTGKILTYSIIGTKNKLHASFKKDDRSKVKFLYNMFTEQGSFITSPYHTASGNAVPCKSVSIENALKEEDPVAGIVKALGKIHSDSEANNGFDGGDFEWNMDGTEEFFTISDMKDVYWADIDGDEGKVKTTDLVAKKLGLVLIALNCSQTVHT